MSQDGRSSGSADRERSQFNSVHHGQSGNMKKELKKTIFENVSNLRTLFVKLRANRDKNE